MPSTAYDVIRRAIVGRKNVRVAYQGHVRDMSPHAVGTKAGHEKALLYQFAGRSTSGLGPVGSDANWRCLFLSETSDVSIIGGQWRTAPRSQDQTCVAQVDVEVD